MCERTRIWVAALVLCTGLAALLCEHIQLMRPLAEGMRALFGLTTTTGIAVVLVTGARCLAGRPARELYQFTRLVSRWVYVLIYVLAIARTSLYVFDVKHVHFTHGRHHAVPAVRSLNDFGFYVACCIIPLWSVRALVLTMPPRQRHGPL